MAAGETIRGQRFDQYHVEIRHPGGDWNHIHRPDWETTRNEATARQYAEAVKQDHPGSAVRLIRVTMFEWHTFATGKDKVGELGREVVDL